MVTRRDLPTEQARYHGARARTRLLAAMLVGALVGAGLALMVPPEYATLIGWDATAAVLLAWVWLGIWPLDAEHTAARAVFEDPTRGPADLLLLVASAVSLVAVGYLLAQADAGSEQAQSLRVGLGVLSVALSWAVVHTVFTLHYARLYYTGVDGGVDFNGDERPCYSDFAYLAFTIGMTFQVSDTAIEDKEIRRMALGHALLSFLFGTGVLALMINLIASLTRG